MRLGERAANAWGNWASMIPNRQLAIAKRDAAMLFGEYPDEIRAVKPPTQVFQALAGVGRALRFKL
jgi:hypothetical protein